MRKELKVCSEPLPPWDGNNCDMQVNSIDTVDGIVISSRSVQGTGHAGISISYSVIALLANGNATTLVGGTIKGESIIVLPTKSTLFRFRCGAQIKKSCLRLGAVAFLCRDYFKYPPWCG